MLPKAVQKVFNKYDEKHAKDMEVNAARAIQPWRYDLDRRISDFEYKQFRREIRITRYQVMGITIIMGIVQAVYLTYLLTRNH